MHWEGLRALRNGFSFFRRASRADPPGAVETRLRPRLGLRCQGVLRVTWFAVASLLSEDRGLGTLGRFPGYLKCCFGGR
ncbi:hypothetical protein NDU88_006674 [Pleurodeles waltl]|uniref:Uncharacterized protein n=1 Tax=Pleurodeles waltl TaxID=8319 RepID=A0AAV7VMK8_PLEWA|nr:hypothetical protein NDU88_006674 [Pleurodeles waltl]